MSLRSVAALGLPLRSIRAAWALTGIVLAIHALTMARDLTFYDSPELALVAHQLGLGHPIGQPLHTWLGFLFAHLPGLDPIVGLTLMSALFGALCVLPVFALAERLCGDGPPLVVAVPLLGAALHPIAWEPSSRVEVYSLAAFLALWALARASSEGARPLWPVGLALGLCASTNAVVAAAFGLALLPLVIAQSRGRRARELGALVLAGLAGLLPFAHVLLVAGDSTRFVWGSPSTPEAALAYFGGADYVHNAGIDAATFIDHLLALASWSVLEASLPIALVGLAAYVWRARAIAGLRWALPIAALSCVAFVARNVVFHTDVPDYRGYFLAPWMACAAGIASLGAALFARGGRFRVYGALVALLPLAALPVTGSHLVRVRDTPSLARALLEGVVAEAPHDAIVIVEADHWVAPLLYAQEVEGARPDLVLLPHGLASSSWYWDHLYARHRELARFALRGPGGRDARVRRFLAANAHRPVLVESWSLADRAELPICGAGMLLWTGACEGVSPREASARIDAVQPRAGEALEVAARVSLARGEALWRLGRGAEAYEALLAGIDAALPSPAPRPSLPPSAPPLRGPLPSWSRDAAIHDPARNVLVAALLLDALAQTRDALALAEFAHRMGLPEASAARAAILARAR